ncbi:MAG: Ycf66 family protein, partial [Synechococcaceae cyanobacterium]|nr:Ycf66 family protein [Synechococcaceae cyanobacterium]
RSFKPALARDYDVFFAAVGLLCGGILFFQGWRLDPILQFGQFLLAGTTVFFAYESVRLRGVTTEQARRSSYFDDEEPLPPRARGGLGGGRDWDRDTERFDEPEPIHRRIRPRDQDDREDDFYRPRRPSRPAIPERAISRADASRDWDRERGPSDRPSEGQGVRASDEAGRRFGSEPSSYTAGGRAGSASEFGARRRLQDQAGTSRRGSRPTASVEGMPRSSRRPAAPGSAGGSVAAPSSGSGVPQGTPIRTSQSGSREVRDADFTPMDSEPSARPAGSVSDAAPARSRPPESGSSYSRSGGSGTLPRDNASRFDD